MLTSFASLKERGSVFYSGVDAGQCHCRNREQFETRLPTKREHRGGALTGRDVSDYFPSFKDAFTESFIRKLLENPSEALEERSTAALLEREGKLRLPVV